MRALSRKFANRKSVLRNLATSMVLYEEIKTTQAKAKEIKPIIELLINRAKANDLAARRFLLGYLFDKNATKKVFDVLVPRYKDIKSGYIKTYNIGNRLGDAAPMMILKLVNINSEIETPVKELESTKEIGKGKDAKTINEAGKEGSVVKKRAAKTGDKKNKTTNK